MRVFSQSTLNKVVELNLIKENNLDMNYKPLNKVFFLGELHNYNSADNLAYDMFNKLKKDCNVKTYCYESSKSTEYIFNYCKKNGNIESNIKSVSLDILLKQFFRDIVEPVSSDFRKNDSLKFICYDIETDLFNSLTVCNHILSGSENKEVFSKIIYDIEFPALRAKKTYLQCHNFINYFEKDTLLFFNNLDNYNYIYIKKIIDGIKPGIIFDSLYKLNKNEDAFNFREKYIAENLLEVFKNKSNSNIFIQIGINHIISKHNSKEVVNYTNIFSLCNNFTEFKPTKIGCVYANIKEASNYWILNKNEIKQMNKNIGLKYTFFNLQNLKNKFDFDYMIYCD